MITLYNYINEAQKGTQEDFIKQAKEKHGDKYDYSEVVYVNNTTPVKIYCKACDKYFEQTPKNHKKYGCKECGRRAMIEAQRKSQEQFIKDAIAKHGDLYDYSKVDYKGDKKKVIIKCNVCGHEWSITPSNLLQGYGCPECGRRATIEKQRKSQEQFIKDAIAIHGDKYDYSKVDYQGNKEPVIIICNKCGTEFPCRPNDHLSGQNGCPECYHSKLEESVLLMLKQNNIKYEREHRQLINGHKRRYDFYLPEYNVVIECQGEQHLISGSERIFKQTQYDNQLVDIEKYKHCVDVLKYRMLYFTNKKHFKAALKITELYNNENTFHDLEQLLNAIVQK